MYQVLPLPTQRTEYTYYRISQIKLCPSEPAQFFKKVYFLSAQLT